MSDIDKLVTRGLAMGMLSHEDIKVGLGKDYNSPGIFYKTTDKLKALEVVCYREPGSQRVFRLINKGRSRGFLTRTEFFKILPADVTDDECINDVIEMLNDMGIEVRL